MREEEGEKDYKREGKYAPEKGGMDDLAGYEKKLINGGMKIEHNFKMEGKKEKKTK